MALTVPAKLLATSMTTTRLTTSRAMVDLLPALEFERLLFGIIRADDTSQIAFIID
ncbi:hypothetical protein ACFQPA_03390 [Halomarina halobia]|uniref:hypothetical protein n=1 Tax=Halomarina halobia TaxID=3033386 RepID=UPI0023E78D92|nr:hypothetical protein [Halomarina sp. PSR21]